MSIIHVNQIKNHVMKLFDGKLDLSDTKETDPSRINIILTRSLAAYAVHCLTGCETADAAKAITDGSEDNGIDAIFYHETERRLYLVQSKWIHDGTGEPSNGEMKKFLSGVRDLCNMRFERFNSRVSEKKELLSQVLNDPQSSYTVVAVYTGINSLAEPSQRDLNDLREEMNDASEVLTVTVLNQASLHSTLTARLAGEPINIELGLKSWGKIESPYLAFYGQVSVALVADWWAKYGDRLFAKNLRGLLGETDVNAEIRQTLEESPEAFWYYNNGITIIVDRITKTMAGGGDTDFGTFHCENMSVVNGAQTVSTIGRFAVQNPDKVGKGLVHMRAISLEKAGPQLGTLITKTNNRQNRIDNRDFVSLDPEQSRLRAELGVEGVLYNFIRSETVQRTEKSFDLVEATTALACASGKPSLFVQLKREIGRLWDDITKAPYKELFNPTVNSFFLWRSVQTQRFIDTAISSMIATDGLSGRDFGISVHGNRQIAATVFRSLDLSRFGDPGFNFPAAVTAEKVLDAVREAFQKLKVGIDADYPNAIVPTLFKNLTKCTRLFR